jgi:KaiC/GvpD/RAD55 family RecA-like ATPase
LQAECVILAGDNDNGAGTKLMEKLWKELGTTGRAFYLKWPGTCKDANQFLLENCKRDAELFRKRIGELTTEAKANPIPHVQSLAESMAHSNWTVMADNPDRLHFPWANVDSMVNILPGAVLNLTATQTGMGKTALLMNILAHACKRGETVLNYSAELTTEEYSNIVAAHVLRKDRTDITQSDLKQAAAAISGYGFYIGRNPDASNSDEVLDLLDKAIPILGATVVAIDHLHHICQGKDNDIKDQNEAAIKIKNMADRHKVKIVVISQPRKSDSKNKGKEIHITDIKGGGGIADAADAVISMHRDFIKTVDPQNPPAEPYESLTKIRLLKGRSQGKGKAYAELLFLGSLATFSEVSREAPPSSLYGN